MARVYNIIAVVRLGLRRAASRVGMVDLYIAFPAILALAYTIITKINFS